MQTTSATFAPFADVRRIDMDIRFELLDVNAKAAAVPTVSGSESVSQLTQLRLKTSTHPEAVRTSRPYKIHTLITDRPSRIGS